MALHALAVSEQPFAELWSSGEADLAAGLLPPEAPATELHRVELFAESVVGLVRKGHPLVRGGRVDLETYASLSHVLVAPRGSGGSFVDTVLERQGLRRHVALTVPGFLRVPYVVAGAGHVSALATSVAATSCRLLPLRTLELPLPLPPTRIFLPWHERTHREPTHRWLRELLTRSRAARALTANPLHTHRADATPAALCRQSSPYLVCRPLAARGGM